MELEISKKEQYKELKRFNIKFPKTYYANSKKEIIEKSKKFDKQFITKHNRGGKGLGVKYFKNTLKGVQIGCLIIKKFNFKPILI